MLSTLSGCIIELELEGMCRRQRDPCDHVLALTSRRHSFSPTPLPSLSPSPCVSCCLQHGHLRSYSSSEGCFPPAAWVPGSAQLSLGQSLSNQRSMRQKAQLPCLGSGRFCSKTHMPACRKQHAKAARSGTLPEVTACWLPLLLCLASSIPVLVSQEHFVSDVHVNPPLRVCSAGTRPKAATRRCSCLLSSNTFASLPTSKEKIMYSCPACFKFNI